jgi:hypothetical protein
LKNELHKAQQLFDSLSDTINTKYNVLNTEGILKERKVGHNENKPFGDDPTAFLDFSKVLKLKCRTSVYRNVFKDNSELNCQFGYRWQTK